MWSYIHLLFVLSSTGRSSGIPSSSTAALQVLSGVHPLWVRGQGHLKKVSCSQVSCCLTDVDSKSFERHPFCGKEMTGVISNKMLVLIERHSVSVTGCFCQRKWKCLFYSGEMIQPRGGSNESHRNRCREANNSEHFQHKCLMQIHKTSFDFSNICLPPRQKQEVTTVTGQSETSAELFF